MALYQRSVMDADIDEDTLQQDDILETPDELLNPEERTYKKRYGDLRRFTQKKDLEIAELKKALEERSRQNLQLPNAEDESAVENWINEYPDIAKIITAIATRQANKAQEELSVKIKTFEEEKRRDAERIAQAELSRIHPDFFDEIRVDEKFHQWLATKSKKIQDALYSDESMTDWQTAADVITLYKSENNIGKKKQPDNRREAAREVPSRSITTPTQQGEYLFSESQINKMNPADYERYEDQITEAWKNNKVLRDMTGGAR